MNFNLNHFILSTIAVTILIISGISEVVAADTTQLRGNRSVDVDSQTLIKHTQRELGVDDTNSTEVDDTNSTESYDYPSLDGTVISTFELVDDIEFSNDSLSSLPRPLCPDAATLTGGWLTGSCSSFYIQTLPTLCADANTGPIWMIWVITYLPANAIAKRGQIQIQCGCVCRRIPPVEEDIKGLSECVLLQ